MVIALLFTFVLGLKGITFSIKQTLLTELIIFHHPTHMLHNTPEIALIVFHTHIALMKAQIETQ